MHDRGAEHTAPNLKAMDPGTWPMPSHLGRRGFAANSSGKNRKPMNSLAEGLHARSQGLVACAKGMGLCASPMPPEIKGIHQVEKLMCVAAYLALSTSVAVSMHHVP